VVILQSMFDLSARAQAGGSGGFIWHCKWRIIYAMHAVLARMPKIHYIALSEAIKQSALRELHLPAKRVSVIPLGLASEKFDARSVPGDTVARLKDELDVDGAFPILLNVARLSAVKGQKDLLEAMPYILERFPRARLLIAGEGPLLTELERLRDRLGLWREVLLLGKRNDVSALLSLSDVFVFSSYYEGLPGSVIEAMAAGRPAVAYDIPSLGELVKDGDTGILVRERKAALLAESIIQLAEHPDAVRQMGERARRLARAKYDIKQNIQELEALYEIILARSSGRSGDPC
jgi:glycosyltransferase involved in cell wall biosynthesis